MSNTKKVASIAFTGAAATAATMMGVAPALAASHFSIKNGGTLYTGVIKGKATNAVLVDATKNTTITCKKAFLSANVSKSHGSLPANVGHVKKTVTKWSSCTGPFGATFKLHFITSPNINFTTANAAGATGKLTGNKISIKISGTGLFSTCKATVSGTSVPLKYVNASHTLAINSGHALTLHFKSAANCTGLFAASDTGYIAVNYAISTPAGLTIS